MYQRLHVHRCYLNNGSHQNIILQNSWKKYGEDKFISYCLEQCSSEELLKKEQYYIDLLNPYYNITKLVIRNEISKESRIKISETLKRRYKNHEILHTNTTKVDVYDIKGNFINTYDQLTICAKDLKINVTSIIRCINKEYKQCKGYQFKRNDDNYKIFEIQVNAGGKAVRKPVPVKQGELLENPEMDNQQPSLDRNIFEGSTTNFQILPDNAEDSNEDTSALHK